MCHAAFLLSSERKSRMPETLATQYKGWDIRVSVYADGDGFTPQLTVRDTEVKDSTPQQLPVPCETAVFASQVAATDAALSYAKRTIDGDTPGLDLWTT